MPKTHNPTGEAPARRLFVFDSMLPGEMRHERLAGCECLGQARTEAVFDLIDFGFDAVLVEGGRTSVRGMLYAVDAATVKRLDGFYGHPGYCRRASIRLANGSRALAYLFPRSRLSYHSRIPGGHWPSFRRIHQVCELTVPRAPSPGADSAESAAPPAQEGGAALAAAEERLRAAEAEAAETDRLADEAYQRWDEAVAANVAAAHRLEQARKEAARLGRGSEP